MTATGYAHIELAPDGAPYIAGTRIGVARIALDYPGLTLGQVYSALAYYYDHKDEIDRQIEDEDEEFRRSRAEWAASNAEFLARLKARRKEA